MWEPAGCGRRSDEGGESVDINVTDPTHSSERRPQPAGSQKSNSATSRHASFAPTGTTALGFLNTSTLPTITSTSPINAGRVHW